MTDVLLVILRSATGDEPWEPVKPEDVPDWVRAEDCIKRLLGGDMAQGPSDVAINDDMRPWYRAVRIVPPQVH